MESKDTGLPRISEESSASEFSVQKLGSDVLSQSTDTEPGAPSCSYIDCSNRRMWAYIIISIVVICICFNLMRMSSSGPLPNGTPSYIDSESIVYVVITISILLSATSTFLYTLGSGIKTEMNTINVLFGLQMVFLILWFYYFYNKAFYKNSLAMGGALILTNLLMMAMIYLKGGNATSLYSMVPSLLLSGALGWASYKASRNS